LAWGAIDFYDGYVQSGQLPYIKRNLRWVNDYFIKCHTATNELYGQVGNGSTDHAWWGSAEVMQMERPSYKIDVDNPGSDLAAETAAAMAAASIVFQEDDPDYSATLLEHAIELYDFADNYRDVYSNSITDAAGYYLSYSGYNDELVWGAIWLYRATNDETYLEKAESYYDLLGTESQTDIKSYKWALAWDDKSYGCYALLAKLTGESQYKEDIERHLDYWTTGYGDESITYTPGGLAYLDVWGALRYAGNTSFLALYYYDIATTDEKSETYYNFAVDQLAYILGDNPQSRSYVCGYGDNPPVNPHHRTNHGCWSNNQSGPPDDSRHTLYGALVGGPDSDDSYTDDRTNYINNEVACDYNALFSGALAKMVEDNGGTALSDFPVAETPDNEYYVEAKLNSEGSVYTEWSIWVYNHTAWPARTGSEYKFQIFIDISEGLAAGYSSDDYVITCNSSDVVEYTELLEWDVSSDIYYCEVTFLSDIEIWPGGDAESDEEAQMRIRLPYDADESAWDQSNDWVSTELEDTLKETLYIPLYVDGELVWGQTPSEAVPVESISLSTTTDTLTVGETVQLEATVLPDDASNSDITWTSSDDSIASVSSDGLVEALSSGEVTVTALSADGLVSAVCSITVNPAPVIDVTSVSLNADTIVLAINEDFSLVAEVLPTDATDLSIEWSSSDSDIVSVNEDGEITGISQGEAFVSVLTSNSSVTASCFVQVTDEVMIPTQYYLEVEIDGYGSVDPVSGTYDEGTVVILTATPDSGFTFSAWEGDLTGSDSAVSLTMDEDKFVTAVFVEQTGSCDNPEEIEIPFEQNGAGEYCFVVDESSIYINSWNLETLEINGVDYTNTWSNSMPDAIDGKYYIYYQGNYDWSHFEINELKSTLISVEDSQLNTTLIYPNPFNESFTVTFDAESVQRIVIVDISGCVAEDLYPSSSPVVLGQSLASGVYFVTVYCENEQKVFKVIKK
jgi:hypothetical protein